MLNTLPLAVNRTPVIRDLVFATEKLPALGAAVRIGGNVFRADVPPKCTVAGKR